VPVHDWTALGAWAFHDFHLAWIAELQKSLNGGLLPADFSAMAECHVGESLTASASPKGKRRTIAIRHVSGHRIVALVEIVSPANKDRKAHVTAFVNKMVAALELGIHVLLIDLFPPGAHDPDGMHGAVWDRFEPDEDNAPPEDRPFALASYTGGSPAKAFVSFVSVGDKLPAVPVFLTAARYVDLELEPGYAEAYAGMPEFWRNVIEKRPA
jgi:Protein of unknown function (DUF4058)